MKKNLTFKIRKSLATAFLNILMLISEYKIVGQVQNIFNHEAILEYEAVLDDFTNLLKSNGIQDPLDVFECYNYALWGGYLSLNHQFQFSDSRDLFFDYAALGCISGDGVCLNIADMLSDIFGKLGYDANTVVCAVNPKNLNVDNIHNDKFITRNVDDVSFDILQFLATYLGYISGNHAITCVEKDEVFYYFDSTNLIYLNKDSINKAQIINGEGSFSLRYLSSLVLSDYGSIKGFFSQNDTFYEKAVYDKNDIDIDELNLEDFYLNHEKQYDIICKEINSKPQLLIAILSLLFSNLIITNVFYNIKCLNYKDGIDNYNLLIEHIIAFLNEHNIKEDFDYTYNLIKMMESGCLSYKKGIQEYKRKLSLAPDIGQEFLFDYKSFKEDIICKILNKCEYETFYIYAICEGSLKISKIIGSKKNNSIHFYDCERNAILWKIRNNILVNSISKEQYKILKIKHIWQKDEMIEPNDSFITLTNISSKEFDIFYEQNENLMDNIAKKLVKQK